MSSKIRISDAGRAAVDDLSFSPMQRLVLEIASRTQPSISFKDLCAIVDSLIARYDSPEAAIEALRDGEAIIERTQ